MYELCIIQKFVSLSLQMLQDVQISALPRRFLPGFMVTFNRTQDHVRSNLSQRCFHWSSKSLRGQKHKWGSKVNIPSYHKTLLCNSWQHKDQLNRLGKQIPIEKHWGITFVVDKATEELSISNRGDANKIPSAHYRLSVYVFQLAGAITKRSLWNTLGHLEDLRIFLSSETSLPKHIKWGCAVMCLIPWKYSKFASY